MSDLPKRLYVGAQNDILYLVDEPPSPAGNDYPLATAGSDPIAKFFASDRRTQQLAQALVDAYNAEIDVADKRAQAHLLAAGWLPPDEAERLRQDLRVMEGTEDATRVALEAQLAAARVERDEAKRVIRNAHEAIRTKISAAEVALAMFTMTDHGGPSLLDELTAARAERAAVQPVIDAARALIDFDKEFGEDMADGDVDAAADHAATFGRLRYALDALDADGQPEGPTT